MLTTNSELKFYDHWRKLQMCACYQSGKTLFLSDEETWTFLNAESDTDHEPPGREVELKYINTNCRKIMHHLQSHWNICKENWCKLKEMYCRIQTNQQRYQLRGIWPSMLLINCMPTHAFIYLNKRNSIICDPWLGHYSLGILKKYLCDKSKGHWRDIYSFSH